MTALCGGAASRIKNGLPNTVVMGLGELSSLLTEFGNGWAVGAAAYLGLVKYDLTTLCSTDPPPVPTLGAADYLALLAPAGNPGAYITAIGRFSDWIAAQAWWHFCECATVSTPAPALTIPAPVGLQIGPPVGTPTAAPCFTGRRTGTAPSYTTPVSSESNDPLLTPAWTPITLTGVTGSPGITYYAVTVPQPPPTSLVVNMAVQFGAGAIYAFGWTLFAFDTTTHRAQAPTGAVLSPGAGSSQSSTVSAPIPASTRYVVLLASEQAQPIASQVQVQADWYCGGTAPNALTSPCAADPLTLSLLQAILAQVNLIQRQAVPFAYVTGAAHAGLSGAGHFAVQGLIGCKVALTTLPAQLGQAGTQPAEIFDAGYITWSTADGYTQSVRVEHNPTLSLPQECGVFTDLAYDLHPGVVVTITELAREP